MTDSSPTNAASSPYEKARMVLQVYRHFGLRPGEQLRENNFVGFAERKGWRPEDLVEGLEYGLSQGWFEHGPNESTRLTAAGFAEIRGLVGAASRSALDAGPGRD